MVEQTEKPLEKQFCDWHIETAENPEGTDCSANLDGGRCRKCFYTIDDIQYGIKWGDTPELYISKTKSTMQGACQDFKPLPHLVDGLVEKLKASYVPEPKQNI